MPDDPILNEEERKLLLELRRIYSGPDGSAASRISNPQMRHFLNRTLDYKPNRFSDMLIEMERVREGLKSKDLIELIEKCKRKTIDAQRQYRNGQLFWTSRYFMYMSSVAKAAHEAGREHLSKISIPDTKTPPDIIKGYSLKKEINKKLKKIGYVYDSNLLDESELMEGFLSLADAIFNKILINNNTEEHWETLKDIYYEVLSSYASLGFIDIINIFRKIDPIDRRRITLRSADSTVTHYEEYIAAIDDWICASRAFQLRIEDEFEKMGIS